MIALIVCLIIAAFIVGFVAALILCSAMVADFSEDELCDTTEDILKREG